MRKLNPHTLGFAKRYESHWDVCPAVEGAGGNIAEPIAHTRGQ